MAEDDVALTCPDAVRCNHELLLLDGQHFTAYHPGGLHPAKSADGDHDQQEDPHLRSEDLAKLFAKQHDQNHQHRQLGYRQEGIGDPHERSVQPPEVAGQDPHRDSHKDGERHRSDGDQQRDATTDHGPRHHVATEVVGSQRVAEGRPEVPELHVDQHGVVGHQHWPEEAGHGHKDEHEEPGECALVSAELSPDVPPQGTVLAEVLGWVGDITRHDGPVVGRHADPSSHSYRIRGSRIP